MTAYLFIGRCWDNLYEHREGQRTKSQDLVHALQLNTTYLSELGIFALCLTAS